MNNLKIIYNKKGKKLKKIIFFSVIFALLFLYPLAMKNSIFSGFDTLFGLNFFGFIGASIDEFFKTNLSPKAYKITLMLFKATNETLFMSLISTLFATILGLILAIILVLTRRGGLCERPSVYAVLDFVVNIFRSFPFIILMIVLIPFTKFIADASIGTTAALVPLTIATAPFIARLIENALIEIDPSIIEAARSFGASKFQIVYKILLVEAIPALINVITLTLIVVVGFSAMAGAIGGGGLGDVAVKYGHQRFQTDVMIYTVVILVVMVQIFQFLGDFLYRRTKK